MPDRNPATCLIRSATRCQGNVEDLLRTATKTPGDTASRPALAPHAGSAAHKRHTRIEKIAESLIKEYGDQKLVAALLQELITSNNDAEVQLTFEKPLSKKSNHRGKQGNRGGNSRGKSRTRFDGKNNKRRGNDKNNQFDRNKGKNNKPNKQRSKKQFSGRTFAEHSK